MKKKWVIWLIIIILLVIILFPKKSGYGAGGFLAEGMQISKEESTCLGIEYVSSGGRLGFMRCMDCGPTHYCIGIPINKKCYEGTLTGYVRDTNWIEVECKK